MIHPQRVYLLFLGFRGNVDDLVGCEGRDLGQDSAILPAYRSCISNRASIIPTPRPSSGYDRHEPHKHHQYQHHCINKHLSLKRVISGFDKHFNNT
jgi:hypothetical protein